MLTLELFSRLTFDMKIYLRYIWWNWQFKTTSVSRYIIFEISLEIFFKSGLLKLPSEFDSIRFVDQTRKRVSDPYTKLFKDIVRNILRIYRKLRITLRIIGLIHVCPFLYSPYLRVDLISSIFYGLVINFFTASFCK